MGVAIGSFAVTALLLRPYAGREADRRGRRALLVGGALLSGLAIAAHAIAPNLTPALWDDPEYATDDWAEGMGELDVCGDPSTGRLAGRHGDLR